jgi:hypothetical protein
MTRSLEIEHFALKMVYSCLVFKLLAVTLPQSCFKLSGVLSRFVESRLQLSDVPSCTCQLFVGASEGASGL